LLSFIKNKLAMQRFIPVIILILASITLTAGILPGEADTISSRDPNIQADSAQKKRIIEELRFHGGLRIIGGFSSLNNFAIRNNASRIGFTMSANLVKGLRAVCGLEVGVGLAGTKQEVIFHGDPGGGIGEIDNVFTSRIGYLGFDTKYGSLTWGKQWSPYYMIAGLTDQFMAYGAEAAGSFPNYTDGGISGTGRASNALQYNLKQKWFMLSLQIQHRDITDTEVYPNTWGCGVLFYDLAGFSFGAAYNKVLDGIPDPKEYEPMKGDEAAVFGLSWQNKRIRFSSTYSTFRNHMTDDKQENYFDGYGLEVYLAYFPLESWDIHVGGNYLKPTSDNVGEYLLQYLVLGTTWSFGDKVQVFVEFKLDDSFNMDGSPGREDIYGFGMYYNFSPPKIKL
jgi:predicted porin